MKSNWRARFSNRKTSKERFTLLQYCKDCYSLRRGAIGQSIRQYTLGIDNQSPFARYIAALDTLLDGVIAEYEKANSCRHEPSRVINVCQAMINNVIWLLNDRVAILYRGNNEQPITDTERIVFICLYHDMFQSMFIFYNTLKKLLCIQGSSIYIPSNSYSQQYQWLILSLKCHLNYSFPRLLYRVTSYNSTVVNSMVTMNTTKKSLQRFLCSKNVIQCIEDYKDIVYPKYHSMSGFEQRRDDLIDQLKNPDADIKKIYDDLAPILCEIRKLKYVHEIPNSTRIIYKPYSIAELQHCTASSIVTLTDDDREQLLDKTKHLSLPNEKKEKKEKESKPKKNEKN
jgi:hypothetical protein